MRSIRTRLLMAFTAFTLIAISVAAAGYFFFKERESAEEFTNSLYKLLLKSEKLIKTGQDFLVYETINPDFYEKEKSPYLLKHSGFLFDTEKKLRDLSRDSRAETFNVRQKFRDIDAKLSTYDATFKLLTEKIKERGFKDYGHVGRMRDFAHKLEKETALDLPDILTLRRHEKDYMIRNDLQYKKKLDKTVSVIEFKILGNTRISGDEKKRLLALLRNYTEHFFLVVDLDHEMGIKSNIGLQRMLKEQTSDIEQITDSLIKEAEAQKEAIESRLITIYLIMITLMLSGGAILSYVISSYFGKPILKLSDTMNRMVESNFDGSIALPKNSFRRDEIGSMHNHFLNMAEKLRSLVKTLQDESENLKESNEEFKITNRKLIESEKKMRTLNTVKNKFFSIIAHDLRGPFNSILGLMNIMRDHSEKMGREELMDFAVKMRDPIDNLYSLTNNLLQWALSQTDGIKVRTETLDAYKVIRENTDLIRTTAEKKNITLHESLEGFAEIYTDPDIFSFIVRNLLSNALKFTPRGGSIWVSCFFVSPYLHISIKDNGIGIAENRLNDLFRIDKVDSTVGTDQEQGTGLGLVLCKEFTELCDGSLYVQSKVNEGSKFTFTMPVHEFYMDEQEGTDS